jgi:membrane protein DedA with SNARE-associated domain
MAEWLIGFMEQYGYLGVAVLMCAENIFPPIPSELIMPFAAFQAARGQLHWAGVLAAGVVGSLLGALPWYFAGRALGLERTIRFAAERGRWLTLTPEDVKRAQRSFERRGPIILVFGRLVPALRTVISLPAGITRTPLAKFLAWSALGSLMWCSLLTAAGYLLEEKYERIARVLNPVSTGILVVLVAWYLWRVVRFGHGERKSPGT